MQICLIRHAVSARPRCSHLIPAPLLCCAVQVVPGQTIVEVKPQGVSKGKAVERILHNAMAADGGTPPDFVLCIGNDRSGAYVCVWCVVCKRVGVAANERNTRQG